MTEVAVLRPTPSDLEAVVTLLSRSSRATRFHRFHGFTDGFAYYTGLLRDRPIQDALLAWDGATCVGVASLAGATGDSDLAVLVQDEWQGRGIGSRLTSSLLDSARAKGVSTVHAEVLGDDLFILRVLRRIGPLAVSITRGNFAIDIDLRGQKPAAPLSDDGLPAINDGEARLGRSHLAPGHHR